MFFNRFFSRPIPPAIRLEKIEVFSRHCAFSSASQHKKRFSNFSREACYRNFLDTIDLEKANLTLFFDAAKATLDAHFLREENRHPVVEIREGTEAGSFLRLLEYVEAKNFHPDTILYFVEDDYLHREGWVSVLLEGFDLPEADYVTLYDHRDKYFLPSYRDLKSKIFATPTCHWRTTPSTTHTFAVRWRTLQAHLPIHRKFSKNRSISADHDKFCALGRRGATLVSSIPGWSTHAEPEFASPCSSWESQFLMNR